MSVPNSIPTGLVPQASQTGNMDFFINVPVNLGSPFFGMWLSCILFGILSLQTWRYFQEYPRDSYRIKIMIIVLWSLDAFDLSLLTYTVYRAAVLNFGNVLALIQLPWMSIVHGGISSVVTLIVQAFFIRRVWVLSAKNKILTLMISILALVSFGAGLEYMIKSFMIHNNLKLLPRYSKGTFIASAVFADVLIAGAQCYYLTNNKTGAKRVDLTIKLMMTYIVNTMLLTTSVAILELVLWVTRNDSTHLIPDWTICRVYSNTLLAVLNTRQNMLQRLDTDTRLDDFIAVHIRRPSGFTRDTTANASSTMGQRSNTSEAAIQCAKSQSNSDLSQKAEDSSPQTCEPQELAQHPT